MSTRDAENAESGESLGSPDHDRGGATIDEAVASSEVGTEVEGVHTPSGEAASGESRVEQMPEVEGVTEGRVVGDPGRAATPPKPGPGPGQIGSGGAQRIVGARISDRVAGGEAAPDGPPFDTDTDTGSERDPTVDPAGASGAPGDGS